MRVFLLSKFDYVYTDIYMNWVNYWIFTENYLRIFTLLKAIQMCPQALCTSDIVCINQEKYSFFYPYYNYYTM